MDDLSDEGFFASKKFEMLGTDIDLKIIFSNPGQKAKAEKALAEAFDLYAQAEKKFSRFDQQSELCILNKNLGKFVRVSSGMMEVVSKAVFYHKQTDGYFDPRIISALENFGYTDDFGKNDFAGKHSDFNESYFQSKLEDDIEIDLKNESIKLIKRIDLSGLVKGYVTDKVSDFFSAQGWENYYVDSGGDMFFAGEDENMNPWLVDVEGISKDKLILDVSGVAIATSGIGKRKWEKNGQRFHHLINPKNPNKPSFDLKSVTVVADSVEKADIWAKAIFLMGREKALILSEKKKIPFLMLYYSGGVFISNLMLQYLYENQSE
ncbi:MAG: hypothetical protein ACD_8C00020G0005 [uncultured bacterium]|nr:MAG: hypothetical protein ACD_8C00020G0005 [uncultured bacterium]